MWLYVISDEFCDVDDCWIPGEGVGGSVCGTL
jgi:hypothetical protein